MMIDMVPPEGIWLLNPDFECGCVWMEDRALKSAVYRISHLQAVYADGSPRNLDKK
jgi:hypothetical protein